MISFQISNLVFSKQGLSKISFKHKTMKINIKQLGRKQPHK